MKYVISVGTNMGDKKANIERAVEAINSIPYTDVIATSSVYQTEPVGYAKQDDFYNAVFLVSSVLNPHEMLGACLGIEAGFGRIRAIKDGPRILDLDVIFAENLEMNEPNLTLPHPRYNERRFVLEPLLELFPDGNAFGIDFQQYIPKIEGQYIMAADKINPDLLGDE